MTSDAYVPSLWCRFMLKTIEEEVEEKKKGWRIAVLIENWHKRPICRCRPIEKCYYCQRQQEAAHDFVYSSMAMSTGERTSHIALCAPKRSSLTRNGAVVKSPSMYGALTFDSPTKELRKDPRYNKAITFTLHFIGDIFPHISMGMPAALRIWGNPVTDPSKRKLFPYLFIKMYISFPSRLSSLQNLLSDFSSSSTFASTSSSLYTEREIQQHR